MSDKVALIAEIRDFLAKHAGISPNYDPTYDLPEERFTGPDASILEAAANVLEAGKDITFPIFSEWGSGTYRPYSDTAARQRHDAIVAKLNEMRKF